jgi:hypothetical protein
LIKLFANFRVSDNLTDFQKELMLNPLTKHLLQGPEEVVRDSLISTHTYLSWNACGRPVFRLTPALIASLLLTDPKDVEPEYVRPPFPTFAVEIPVGFWETENYNGTVVPVRTVWVHNNTSMIQKTKVSFEEAATTPHRKLVAFALCGRGVSLHDTVEQHPLIDTTMEDWLTKSTGTKFMAFNLPQTKEDFHVRLAMRRLYVNLCLYVNERGRGQRMNPDLPKRKQKSRRKKEEKIRPDTWVLGKEINLDKDLVESAKDWVRDKGGQQNQWKIRKRSVTRGHWRNQAHGPGRSMRKKIWIAPFWRGPREGATIQHMYTGTNTGRMQCAKPNEANGPKEAK